jgi:hypothetical protein
MRPQTDHEASHRPPLAIRVDEKRATSVSNDSEKSMTPARSFGN